MNNKIHTLIKHLSNFLQSKDIITNPANIAPFLQEKRNNFKSFTNLVVTPNTTLEVSKILNLCNNLKIGVVPLSGNTGLVGGGVSTFNEIIISLKNLNQIREIDSTNHIAIFEAGVKLNNAINICKQHNLLFPLDLPSRNEALIGGNLATNAGGLNTIKYGQIKHFTLGLEIALANGHIVSDLNKLTKRNIGSDYKNLFIGSEGILGIITAASFKIAPLPKQTINVLFSVNTINQLIDVYLNLKKVFYNQISACEAINKNAVKVSLSEFKNSFFPISTNYNWYALITLDYYINTPKNTNIVVNLFQKLQNTNHIIDYYIQENTKHLWTFRDLIPKAQTFKGASIKHDIAIPLTNMENFINESIKKIHNINPNAIPIIFGHIGDESLHFNFSPNTQNNSSNLLNTKNEINKIILNLLLKYNGNFSAEHGIGLLHKENLKKYYFNNQYYMLKLLKQKFDPNNILNPNKILNN